MTEDKTRIKIADGFIEKYIKSIPKTKKKRFRNDVHQMYTDLLEEFKPLIKDMAMRTFQAMDKEQSKKKVNIIQ